MVPISEMSYFNDIISYDVKSEIYKHYLSMYYKQVNIETNKSIVHQIMKNLAENKNFQKMIDTKTVYHCDCGAKNMKINMNDVETFRFIVYDKKQIKIVVDIQDVTYNVMLREKNVSDGKSTLMRNNSRTLLSSVDQSVLENYMLNTYSINVHDKISFVKVIVENVSKLLDINWNYTIDLNIKVKTEDLEHKIGRAKDYLAYK